MKPSTRTSFGLLSLLVPLTLVPPGLAQQPVLSPEVHTDHRVTFRLEAPAAEEVVLTGEFMDGSRAMTKGADGVWSVTVGPITPEVYEYEFTIDGVTFLDPRNPVVKTNQGPSAIASLLTVRGDEPLFFDVRPVPHGTVEIRTYDSRVTGLSRQVYIYTPPGYDESTEALPVLYLLHGADGEDRSWTMLGRAHTILDNLIADGQSAPMVIVIPYGYAYPWDAGVSGEKQREDFLADLKTELIPFVEANYRISGDREHRALAGLPASTPRRSSERGSAVGPFHPSPLVTRHEKALIVGRNVVKAGAALGRVAPESRDPCPFLAVPAGLVRFAPTGPPWPCWTPRCLGESRIRASRRPQQSPQDGFASSRFSSN